MVVKYVNLFGRFGKAALGRLSFHFEDSDVLNRFLVLFV